MTRYHHHELGEQTAFGVGFFTPENEVRLAYEGREVLYVTGERLEISSDKCGTGSYPFALVIGFITGWQSGRDIMRRPISDVEPITDNATQEAVRSLIAAAVPESEIDFWMN